jgi:hypothetical protein
MKVVYRGKVTRVTGVGAYVEVPHVGTGYEFGPCEVPADIALEVGDRVVVGKIEEVDEDFVIIAKVANVGVASLTSSPSLQEVMAASSGMSGPNWSVVRSDGSGVWTINPLMYEHVSPLVGTAPNTIAAGNHLHDDRYFTETELLTNGALDGRYYTETELLSGGALDGRYFTETELTTGGVLDSRYDGCYIKPIIVSGTTLRRVRNIALAFIGNDIGYVIIQTNIGRDNGKNVDLHIQGVSRVAYKMNVDLNVSWYHGVSTIDYAAAINKGSYPFGNVVSVMNRTSDNKLAVVLGTQNGSWGSLTLAVDAICSGISWTDAEFADWTITRTESLAGYTTLLDAGLNDLNAVPRRVVHDGTDYPSRPPVRYVEWLGPTLPPGMAATDTWVNNTP